MKKEIVTEFNIGKIVAEDIYNNQGQLLLKEGNPLSPFMVNRLHKDKIMHFSSESIYPPRVIVCPPIR